MKPYIILITVTVILVSVSGADYMIYGQGSDALLSRPYCNSWYDARRYQVLISPDYLDTTLEGSILGFSLHSGNSSYLNGEYYLNDIYLCYTDLDQLTDTYATNYGPYTPANVLTAAVLDLDWTNYDWQEEMVLDSPWYYDGTSNFILEFTYDGDNGGVETGNYARGWYPSGGNLVLDANNKNATTGDLRTYSNWIRFNIDTAQAIESASLGGIKAVFK